MTPALLFDLDGTLVDTDPLHYRAFRQVFATHGIEVDWSLYRRRLIGRVNADIAADFFPDLPDARRSAVLDVKEAVFRSLLGDLRPLPGLIDLLDWARAVDLPCAVVTNAPRRNAELILGRVGLESFMRTLVCGPDLPHAKPHPLPHIEALQRLGGEARTSIAFEDSPSGTSSAVGAGLAVVGLLTSVTGETLLASGATLAATDYRDQAVSDLIRSRTGCVTPGERAGVRPARHPAGTSGDR